MSSPKFYTEAGHEVRFVAAEFPGDEEWAISGARRVAHKADITIDEELYVSRLHSGHYWCFRILVAGECVGGVVTEVIRKEHSGKELLHVWLIWGGRVREWLSPALDAAKQMANDIGADGVMLASARWAWVKLLPTGRLSWVLEI